MLCSLPKAVLIPLGIFTFVHLVSKQQFHVWDLTLEVCSGRKALIIGAPTFMCFTAIQSK